MKGMQSAIPAIAQPLEASMAWTCCGTNASDPHIASLSLETRGEDLVHSFAGRLVRVMGRMMGERADLGRESTRTANRTSKRIRMR